LNLFDKQIKNSTPFTADDLTKLKSKHDMFNSKWQEGDRMLFVSILSPEGVKITTVSNVNLQKLYNEYNVCKSRNTLNDIPIFESLTSTSLKKS